MANAHGVAKQVRYKKETTFGTAAGTSGGQILRRTTSNLKLGKDTYASNEIRPDRQDSDYRHGVRRVSGNIAGELSPGTYADLIAAAVRKAYAAVSDLTGLSITVAGSGPTYTLTRGSGSFLTDGVKIGHVRRLTAGSFAAANLNKNLFVVGVTALALTVIPLNAAALTAEGPIASATLATPGKVTYVPSSSHTADSFTVEHWFSDVSQSELYTGCMVDTANLNLPATGMATVDFGMVGQDRSTDTAVYFTSPTAVTSTGIAAAVNGVLVIDATKYAIVTGLTIAIANGIAGEPVVGSNTIPDLSGGKVMVSGQFSAYFPDGTLRDKFDDETELKLLVALTTSNDAAADFIALAMTRVKLTSDDPDDGDKKIIRTYQYKALLDTAGGSGAATEATTLMVQDSDA